MSSQPPEVPNILLGYDFEPPGRMTKNATRYEEGDTVTTPQGVGVVGDVLTEAVESDGEEIDASESSPTYVVLTENQGEGFNTYKASDLHSTTFAEEVENPESDLAGVASNSRSPIDVLAGLLTSNQNRFEWPQSWVDSETPARVIALKAFAGMGGSFDGCVREMQGNISQPEDFCANFLDRLVGNPYWRGDSPLPGD